MKKMTKVLLVLTVLLLGSGLLFLTDIVNASGMPVLYALFPIGASLYGLFLISLIFEKRFAAPAEPASQPQENQASTPEEKSQPARKESSPVSAHHAPSHA